MRWWPRSWASSRRRQCPAEDLPMDGGSVDLLTSMTAAHWFDRPRFLLEVDRVLKPGGCVALLSYGMDMELEHGDVSHTLNQICQEFFTALIPFRNPHLGTSSIQIYKDMYALCSYPEKLWYEGLQVRRDITVSGFIGLVQTFTAFRKYLETDPREAEELCRRISNKLLDALQVSTPDADVTMVTKYFYWIARKPQEDKDNS
uniref:Methyltransferase type 11 domain-containing protein n=1 Tax=Knipowitschia caucasica TaxID=637954 RepID=A0AAV2J5K3_KNICA